jgi:hypothetical protein
VGSIIPIQDTMRRVVIEDGWLIDQFAEHVLGLDMTDEGVKTQVWLTEINPNLADALIKYDALVVQKNKQYKDAWQVDGPITALVDLKDKLYRLEAATEKGASVAWDKDKLTGTLYDIMIRTVMALAWFGLNFQDDDDDRVQPTQLNQSTAGDKLGA